MAEGLVAHCYLRVSTEEQAASGYSLAGQREKLALFAQLQGYQIVGWYSDEGASAKDLNRPAFARMMQEAGRGDVILVYKLDRLTRSVRDLDELLRRFETQGLHFRSVTEQFDTTTATGRLMIRMVAEFAQWERETIAERTAFGKQKKAAAGEWGGGRPPFGYQAQPSGRTRGQRHLAMLVPDPAAAPAVVAIYQRYLAGHGLRAIATWLNDELGVRSAQGRPFDAVKVSRILQNPVYAGLMPAGPPEGPRRLVAGQHQALISVEQYEQVQETFRQRKRLPPRQATGAYPLSGVARCGVCGGSICAGKASRGRQAGQYWYRCQNYTRGAGCGGPGRSLTSTPGPAMEALLVSAIAQLGEPDHLAAFYRTVAADEQTVQQNGSAVAWLCREIDEARRAMERWDRLYEADHLEMAEYLRRIEPHQQRLPTLQARLAEAERSAAVAADLADAALSFPAIWAAAGPPQRKALLQQFVAAWGVQICLYPGQRLQIRKAGAADRG